QGTELIEADSSSSLGLQIGIEKCEVGDLVVGVVVDVLRKVLVESLQLVGVDRVAGAEWDLVVLNTPKFVVLDPEVRLEDFCGGGEPQQGGVALGQAASLCVPGSLSESTQRIA